MIARAWGPLLALVVTACGGIADQPRSSTAGEVNERSLDGTQPVDPARGGASSHDPATGGEPAEHEEPADGDEPAAGGAPAGGDEPAAGGQSGEGDPPAEGAAGSGSTEPERGCEDVCATLAECAAAPMPDCNQRCTQSVWVETHDLNCLALRVYWINEEGCEAMLEAYSSFEPDDNCAD